MSISKKHFEGIAADINATLWEDDADPATVMSLVGKFLKRFPEWNDHFDGQRFIAACVKDRDTVSQPGWNNYKVERERLGL